MNSMQNRPGGGPNGGGGGPGPGLGGLMRLPLGPGGPMRGAGAGPAEVPPATPTVLHGWNTARLKAVPLIKNPNVWKVKEK